MAARECFNDVDQQIIWDMIVRPKRYRLAMQYLLQHVGFVSVGWDRMGEAFEPGEYMRRAGFTSVPVIGHG
jgi:hypothetical protein